MFDEIIEFFGGQPDLAHLLGVHRSAISQWKVEGVPFKRALQIEILSKGLFKAVDITEKRL